MSGDSITILALWLRKLSSLGISKISMFRPLEKILQYSDSGINFQRISTKLKFEPCESIRYLLSTNSFGFGTLRTSTHGHGCSKKLDTRQSKLHLISAKMIIETFQEYYFQHFELWSAEISSEFLQCFGLADQFMSSKI